MIISLITATSYNGVIGKAGRIPWVCKEDMKFFKEKTIGHPVIMGRKTYDSFPEKVRPLPDRFNVVLSRNPGLYGIYEGREEGPLVVSSLAEAIDYVDEMSTEVFIIGGEQVYKEALDTDIVDRMYINVLHAKAEGDTYFPYFDLNNWKKTESETVYKEFKSFIFIRNRVENNLDIKKVEKYTNL
jgi:dihydrofolate reductase